MAIPVDAADAEKNAPDPTIEDKPFQGKQKKEDDDPAPAEKKPRIASTPPSLKALLPNKGNSGEVYILRNPKTFGYQFRYPTSFLARTMLSNKCHQWLSAAISS